LFNGSGIFTMGKLCILAWAGTEMVLRGYFFAGGEEDALCAEAMVPEVSNSMNTNTITLMKLFLMFMYWCACADRLAKFA
jgi:hypothetical protein